ncbi:MAG TPA: contractile injection system tape measure protein [Polyangiaceae bacterium]|nr:contractile injection system tape measure protein [Polyangiaceae bacterium]
MSVHQVRSVEVEVVAPSRVSAVSLTESVSRLGHSQLKAVLERVFREASPGAAIQRIDLLELDLGSFPEIEFEAQFPARLEQKLRLALASLAGGSAVAASKHHDSLELLAVFARTGNLLWWARPAEREVVLSHLRELARQAPGALLTLLRTLLSDLPALGRLSSAADRSVLVALLGELLPHATQELVAALDWLDSHQEGLPARSATPAVEPASEWRPGLRRAVFRALASKHAQPSLTSLEVLATIVAVLRERQPGLSFEETSDRGALPALLGALNAHESAVVPLRPVQPEVDAASDRAPQGARLGAPEQHAATATAARRPMRSSTPLRHQPVQPMTPTPLERSAARARRAALESLEEVVVTNCGLILLWPFLERYFERQGLCTPTRKFLDWAAQSRAVRLLELLASGDPEPPEFRLPLAKLLCGMTPDAELCETQPTEDSHFVEAERLLAAAIDRIPGLQDLSIAVFRQLFLQRAGVLEASAGAWSLRVESEAQDVALSRAPWSWEWVRLPWMPDPIRVDWR